MASNGEATLLLKIKQVGAEALDRVVISLTDIGNIAGFITGKLYDAGKALVDLVFEGSKIEQINKQFDFLAEKAGASAHILKKELVGATQGLADDTDVIQAASRALLLLDGSAEKLPKLMEVATASSKFMGVSVTEAFERITMAIAGANAKGLRSANIFIDQEDACRKMAQSLNLNSKELTKNQEVQATLNAVIEKGSAGLIEASRNADSVGEAFTRMKNGAKSAYDAMAVGAKNQLGGFFSKVMNDVGGLLGWIGNKTMQVFGNDAERTAAKMESLTGKLNEYRAVLEKLGGPGGPDMTGSKRDLVKWIAQAEKELTALEQTETGKRIVNAQKEADDKNKIKKLNEEQQIGIETRKNSMLLALEQEKSTKSIEKKRLDMAMEFATQDEKAVIQAQYDLKTAEAEAALAATKVTTAIDNKTKLAAIEAKFLADKKVMTAKANLDEATLTKDNEEKLKASRANFLGFMSNLQSSSNKELVAIGKAAAIAQITIATAEAVGHANNWGNAIGGPVLASVFTGLAYAAGAAQIAKVAGVQLAEGGIVMPRPGGTQATIGEAGQPEAVIPLDKAGSMGFGGGVTIIVNGGLLGDAASAREFAIAVDRQLLELRRNNESVSFDSRVV